MNHTLDPNDIASLYKQLMHAHLIQKPEWLEMACLMHAQIARFLCEMLLSEMDHEQLFNMFKDDSAALAGLYQFSGDTRLLPLMENLHRRQSLTGDLGL
jgi:hypothetical protein